MGFFKKFNLLDWVIVGAFLLVVALAVYNFMPENRSEKNIKLIISLSDPEISIKNGDPCTDAENGNDLGRVQGLSVGEFYVNAAGTEGKHGAEINGTIYLCGMPLELYIGDWYAAAAVKEIHIDS